jgi:restriction system protein
MARRRRRRSSSGTRVLGAFLVLVVAGAIIKILSSPLTWLILLPVAIVGLVLRYWLARRRHAVALERRREWLAGQSCLAAADAMSGSQFEQYIAEMMRLDGHQDVRLVGGPGDGGADILSTEPAGRRVAIQCKRQMAPVPIGVVRELNGTLAHEHPGRAGVLVTTAALTRPAAELAARTGITVVDRSALASWMSLARTTLQRQAPASAAVLIAAQPTPVTHVPESPSLLLPDPR